MEKIGLYFNQFLLLYEYHEKRTHKKKNDTRKRKVMKNSSFSKRLMITTFWPSHSTALFLKWKVHKKDGLTTPTTKRLCIRAKFCQTFVPFFSKKKFSPQNGYSTVKPPAKKIQKKLELEKTFFPHYTLSLVSKSSAHAFYIMIQFLQSLLDDADAVFCCILLYSAWC